MEKNASTAGGKIIVFTKCHPKQQRGPHCLDLLLLNFLGIFQDFISWKFYSQSHNFFSRLLLLLWRNTLDLYIVQTYDRKISDIKISFFFLVGFVVFLGGTIAIVTCL